MMFKFGSRGGRGRASAHGEAAGKGSTARIHRGTALGRVPDILPYVAPMFAYVALGGLEGYLPQVDKQPSPFWYPIAYVPEVAIVAALAWWYRETWKDLRPSPSIGSLILAILTGLLVTGLWVGLDGHYPSLPFGSTRRRSIRPGCRWGRDGRSSW